MKYLLPLLLMILSQAGCNKVVVHGKDRPMPEVSRIFAHSVENTFQASKKALLQMGYEISKEDISRGELVTKWVSTKSTSHYTGLFDQKDYGTVGSYFHMVVGIQEQEGKSLVHVATPVKSLAGHQRTSFREEKKFFRKLATLLRGDDLEMTNLGVD